MDKLKIELKKLFKKMLYINEANYNGFNYMIYKNITKVN